MVCKNDRYYYVKGPRLLMLPTAFTPNADGINDVFRPIVQGISTDSFSVRVLNPSGTEVYRYSPAQPFWDITDSMLLNTYQYYVDITVLDPDEGKISTCAPLFLLKTTDKGCIPNTHPEDNARYVFEDQFIPPDTRLLPTRDYLCP